MITIGLSHQSKEPIYEQIYKHIRREIKEGNLTAGTKLPSSRGLAVNLLVSRNTVDMAYAQLVSEGYIESKPKRGYFVCELETVMFCDNNHLEDDYHEEAKEEIKYWIDFSPNGVDMGNFPYNKWRRIMKDIMIDNNNELFQSGHPQGDLDFRKTIRTYLHEARGVNCYEEQIIIGAGNDYLLLLLAQLFSKDSVIALEAPTYPQAYHIFKSLGFETRHIPLDKQGMDIEKLRHSDAKIAYVTPSHQYPTGVVMPINRRMQLLSWANEEERYIIEDDYDSEFRFQGRPIPSFQGNDTHGNVIYIGTFSKAIAPAIRISYMVLPQKLLRRYKERLSFYSSTVSRIDQAVLNRFMVEGHYERHLNKMRGIYKNKHDILLMALKTMGGQIRIFGESAGLHLLIEYNGTLSEEELINSAAQKGICVYPLSRYYMEGVALEKPVIVLGFARLSEKELEQGIAILKTIW